MADRLAQDGWRDLGYTYLNIDDCWIGGRDAQGYLVPDPKRFPNGIAFLADYVSPTQPCPLAWGWILLSTILLSASFPQSPLENSAWWGKQISS